MKYVIKFLFHFLLLASFVYMFYFQGQLEYYNFWEWCWTVGVSIIGLLNFYFLIVGVQISQEKDSDSNEKLVLRLSGFVDFIIVLSIWLMGTNLHFRDYTFLICVLGIFLLSSGINKFTFSLVTFTSSIWLFILFNSLAVWHSWLLFFIIIISCLASTITIFINDVDDSETPPYIECVGLLVSLATFIYSYFISSIELYGTPILLVWLCYLICSFFAYIRDNIIMFQSVTWLSVTYFVVFMFSSNNVLSLSLLAAVSLFCSLGMFLYYNYKKRMITLMTEMLKLNQNLGRKYNNLVDDYNYLVKNIKKGSSSNSNSLISIVGRGAVSGAVSTLIKIFMG